MPKKYKLTFEVVPFGANTGKYYHNNGDSKVKPGDVPDQFWNAVEREDDDPWAQYTRLKLWAVTGEKLIRNVRLYELETEPKWVEVVQ